MYVLLIAGLTLVGLSAALVVRAAGVGRVQAQARMRSIELYASRSAEQVAVDEPEAPSELELRQIVLRIGARVLPRLSSERTLEMRKLLNRAGMYGTTPEALLGCRILAVLAAIAGTSLYVIGAPSIFSITGMLAGAGLGWRLPLVVVERRAAERSDRIDRDLPEMIDLLVVSVEAGVGLSGALQMTSTRMDGPLGEELRLTLREQSMGLSSDQALEKLLQRCDTPSVRSFVRSVQQGERLGVSIGQILRGLAIEMRTRRRQTAEERAQKAPVKILFPLVFLIFPAMFVVLLGPAFFRLQDALG